MAFTRREFSGNAVPTTLSGAIASGDTTIGISSATGWPTGSVGPFFVVIDRGLPGEEKVRIASRTSTSLTVASSGRGADGTSASAHAGGAAIEHCLTKTDVDEANDHIATTTYDHHTQYMDTVGVRHDLAARHTFGASTHAYPVPATPADIGTTAAVGTGVGPPHDDHVHELGEGSIDASALFAAGVVDANALGTSAVTSAKILDGTIATADIASGAITSALIADGTIATADIANAAITNALLAGSIQHGKLNLQAGAEGSGTNTTMNADGTTVVDISGCTKTLTTVNANALLLVVGIFDFNITANPSTAQLVGYLNVDGTDQTQTGVFTVKGTVNGQANVAQAWVITLATAASHTWKLRGKFAVAGIEAGVAGPASTLFWVLLD